ncbi:Hypothetical predicted protein [Mytilus galloprovincialis]|uniref:Farnesoic acid O-methyl transferase domain-containing protein n=1 Tax=Mytilus galloprovincialis TaxID=29158 RepID=A0A8B6HFY3_MYTGA|nr:Hypothetical predicted protein [Mytilus galloprovincialis]
MFLIVDEIQIRTLNTGNTDYYTNPNIFEDYTSLSDYHMFPSENQSVRFTIEACHDAYILFSAAFDVESHDFYEICLGGSGNQETYLRRKYNDANPFKISTPDILGCTEKSTFEIRWTIEGTIHIAKESAVGTETIIDVKNSTQLLIRGVGIRTAWGSDGLGSFESATIFGGLYCGVPSTYGSMNVLPIAIKRSRIVCLFKCSPNSACRGVHFHEETNECELVSVGQVIDQSIRSGACLDEIWIKTLDSGEVDATKTEDVFNYYTNLSVYHIFPSQNKFRFSVKACHDAFILLSAAKNLQSQDFYEICIGARNNTRTVLRRNFSPNNVVSNRKPGTLNCTEKTTFLWNGKSTIK